MNLSRYQEVRRVLAAEIASGQFAIGDRFPTDKELCDRFSVSRQTVREALRQLQESGLLTRRRGSGTVLAARTEPTLYVHEISSLGALSINAAASRFEIRFSGRTTLHEPLAKLLGCRPGEKWMRFSGVRRQRDTGKKLAWTDVLVPARYAAVRDLIGAETGTVTDTMQQRFGLRLSRVEQEIRAQRMPEHIAKELDAIADAPALSVLRRYYDETGQIYEIAVSVYDAEDFTFKTELLARDTPDGTSGASNSEKSR